MEDTIKQCPMCRMDISAKAKKCPYCHQFQNRLSIELLHPVFPAVVIVLIIGGMTFLITDMLREFSPKDDMKFEDYPDAIRVVESSMSFGQSPDGEPTVVVTGTLRNSSDVNWKDVYIEVAYRGPDGHLVDVAHCRNYSLIARAGESAAFKASSKREFPEDQYVSHVAVVKWAKEIDAFP